jgi:hypothetical protein
MHDLVTDVDRSAMDLQCTLDNFDRAIDAGTKTSRLSKK